MVRITKYQLKLVKENSGNYNINKQVRNPLDAKEAINTVLDLNNEHIEKFGILALDTKNNIIGVHIISMGSLNTSIVHPREVFKAAILNNANSIILFHNHPSGDTTPSGADISVTKMLVEAGKVMQVDVYDHIIVGEENYCSLKEMGIF
jgi:DNA repair protein RadC